ncbi:transposase [Streptomyces inhibens]|uniref:transposase n=1 Tax=Streptomyces inhibens TaxID=2293571 RepID=UPI003CC94398
MVPYRTGLPWRGLSERFGPWQTERGRFARWATDGTFDRLLSSQPGRRRQGLLLPHLPQEDARAVAKSFALGSVQFR